MKDNFIIYQMGSYLRVFVLGFLALGFLSSCDQNRFFEQNNEIQDEAWTYDDIKNFEVQMEDTNSLFNFYLNVRNTNEYPFANLYVFVETTFPDSLVARDTIELQLASRNGEWLGSGQGRYKYNQFILRKGMRFVQKGNYSFRIEQGMRSEILTGISDIGIRLEYYP